MKKVEVIFGVVTNSHRAFREYKGYNDKLLNSLEELFNIDIEFLMFDTPMSVKGINNIIGYTVIYYHHPFHEINEIIICIKQRLLTKKELKFRLYET